MENIATMKQFLIDVPNTRGRNKAQEKFDGIRIRHQEPNTTIQYREEYSKWLLEWLRTYPFNRYFKV